MSDSKQYPSITVVIPHRNMPLQLHNALEAFRNQDFPGERIEIIVVDNGSTEDVRAVTEKHDVTCLKVPSPTNPYVCRNAGMRRARHQWILLSDASCVPERNYLTKLVEKQTATAAELVVANVQFDVSRASTLGEIVDSLHFMRNDEYADVRKVYPGCALFFHRSLLEKVGYFRDDMRSGADFVWTRRVHECGLKVAYAAEALVLRKGVAFTRLLRKAHRLGWGHGTMARENGTYATIDSIWRMRPPGMGYLAYVLKTRGRGEFNTQRLRIWFGLWLFRAAYNVGRLHVGKRLSD